jgi:hypothetical protein
MTDFSGANQLIDRLTWQLKNSGMTGDVRQAALDILKSRGHVNDKGELTEAGKARNAMTAKERALDRAKRAGRTGSLTYNPQTNRVTRR